MGHLIRIRNLIQAVSEKTTWRISSKRKEQLIRAMDRAVKIKAELDKIAEGKGALATFARAMSLNIADYIEALKSTRFVD